MGTAARRALLEDKDGRVRAEAARFLGKCAGVSPVLWLIDATYDELPSVREAAARSLDEWQQGIASADCGDCRGWRCLTQSGGFAARLRCRCRSSVRASAIAALKAVLGDPFWRVRHAAIQALTVLWQSLPAEREQILLVSPGMTRCGAWGRIWSCKSRVEPSLAAYKAQGPAANGSATDQSQIPAVTTARLRARPMSETRSVICCRCSPIPHTQLRELAIDRLARLSKTTELEEVCQHMAIPGLPHALESAAALLDRTGKRAAALTSRILQRPRLPRRCRAVGVPFLQNHGGSAVRCVQRCCILTRWLDWQWFAVLINWARAEWSQCSSELEKTKTPRSVRSAASTGGACAGVPTSAAVARAARPDSRPTDPAIAGVTSIIARDDELLTGLADDEHPLVSARALRALGELGRLSDLSSHSAH
jgi:hypothetical protein